MKLIISQFGGELEPKDRIYSNALHGYNEKFRELLIKHDVPICGELNIHYELEKATWICAEGDEHGRYERGFNLKPVGKNLNFKKTIYKEQLKEIQNDILKKHDMKIPLKILFGQLKVDLVAYTFPRKGTWIDDTIICYDKNESVDSVIEEMAQSQSEIFRYEAAGEIKQVRINLFEDTERYVFNSLKKRKETKPAIIIPEISKYYHFWTDYAK